MADRMMATQADAINAMLKDVPIGRLGSAEEIANAVLWFCSPAASLVVGGGVSAAAIVSGFKHPRESGRDLLYRAAAAAIFACD